MDEPSSGESPGGGKRRPGRPAKTTDPASSAAAALGAELRRLRIDRGLTLGQLGRLVGYSGQHLGGIERGSAVPSEVVVSACDAAVLANGRLVAMLPAVIREQARARHQHEAARRPARSIDLVGPRARQVCDQDDLDWERLADATRRSSRLSTAVVDDLELITDRQRRLYHELSSAEMEEAQRLTLTSLATFAARGSVAGLHRVRELRGMFRAQGHVRAAAAIDDQARALKAAAV